MSATITAAQVKQLRDATQAGMMDAKKALQEANGDFDAAVTLLREKGIAKAGKLGGRETTEGRVGLVVEGDKGAIIEVGCNTDFVAKNDDFGTFVSKVANHVLANSPANVDELLAQEWEAGVSVEQARSEASSSTGENIQILNFAYFDADGGVIGSYLHGTGIGVIVDVDGPNTEDVQAFAKEVAMHAAAAAPKYLTRSEVPAADVEAERAIYIKQVEDKPEQIREKIAEGKLDKWYAEQVLLEQTWIFGKDRIGKDVSIEDYAKLTAEKAGAPVSIRRFARFSIKG